MKLNKSTTLILKIVTVIALLVVLLLFSLRKTLFPSNPYKLNYTKVNKMSEIIDTGTSPKKEKTFFLTFGSRNCPACTQLYQTMAKYNELSKGKTTEEGYIPFWTTDVDLEFQEAASFAMEYLHEENYTKWDRVTKGNFENAHDIVTPTTFYVKDGKLQGIIKGAALEPQVVVDYVKNT